MNTTRIPQSNDHSVPQEWDSTTQQTISHISTQQYVVLLSGILIYVRVWYTVWYRYLVSIQFNFKWLNFHNQYKCMNIENNCSFIKNSYKNYVVLLFDTVVRYCCMILLSGIDLWYTVWYRNLIKQYWCVVLLCSHWCVVCCCVAMLSSILLCGILWVSVYVCVCVWGGYCRVGLLCGIDVWYCCVLLLCCVVLLIE